MELLTPSRHLEKSPFKDVTNSTPTPGLRVAGNSPQKVMTIKQRSKRSMITPQRRSTRLSSLKSEQDEMPQTVITTRSRRKVTPGPESVTARKRSSRKDTGDSSASSGKRTRRSISTLPSSPLAAKNSPVKLFSSPSEPRSTRSNRSSTSATKTITIPIINESELEGNTSPLKMYDNQNNESFSRFGDATTPFEQYPLPTSPQKSTMTPFKRYPLPASPLKSITLNAPLATPVQRLTPGSLSVVKSLISENDVFAISPGMFPRKTKRIDYLDILADAERKAFLSPVKQFPKSPAPQSQGESESPLIKHNHPDIIDAAAEEVAIEAEDEQPELDVEMAEVEPTETDHPHFALLSYLADVASVSQHLPEEPAEEEFVHEGIENILTAAALAESMKEEIFMEEVMAPISAKDDDDSDVDIDIMTVDDEAIIKEVIMEEADTMVSLAEKDEQAKSPPDDVSLAQENTDRDMSEIPYDVTNSEDAPSFDFSQSLAGIETNVAEHQEQLPKHQMTVVDDDWESLISFSEADDTVAVENINAEEENVQNPMEPSGQEAEQNMGTSKTELSSLPSEEKPTPAATVGINEVGEFVSAEIKFFEDAVETDEVPVQNGNPRESLGNNVTFSVPPEQALIKSPPKRHLSSSSQQDTLGIKKRKTGPVLPNTTRLDILRKRATRLRSREARHNIKRRDFTTALQPVLDNLPSPKSKVAHLKQTPALIPPSLAIKRLQSPVTPAPTKRQRAPEDETPLGQAMSPVQRLSVRKEAVSPRKHIIIHPSPVKETPKPEFRFVFDTKTNDENAPPEQVPKPTPRYEVYSKIFGPPPQLSKHLVEKDTTAPLKFGDLQNTTQILTAESNKIKSPVRKRRLQENDTDNLAKKKMAVELGTPSVLNLGRPVRNESFAVPSIPVPPGPPQLPPSIQRNNNSKRFTGLGQSVLPSPAQPPPSVIRSSLPRPASVFGSALPVPATRRSTRVPKVAKEVGGVGKSVVTNATTTALPRQQVVAVPEKKGLLNGLDNAPAVSEKIIAPPAPVFENVVHSENVTMERPKGKLGGAQRVTRGAAENKKVEVSTRPTRPLTPPLTSLSMKELKSLTEANTKKNDGFKMVNLTSVVKRVNRKRPGEPSDDFIVGKGAKWSKTEALPEWDRDLSEDGRAVRWKSPRFATRTEKRGAMRVKPILKKREREKIEKEEELLVAQSEPLVVQKFVYKGEK